MKKLLVVVLVLIMGQMAFGKVVGVLPELMKPTSIAVGENRLYVTQEATVFIYDLNTLKLIKKFGKAGEGPEEFALVPGLPLTVLIQDEHIQVNSANRITLFTKDGKFMKMIKTKGGTLTLGHQPVGDHYVAIGFAQEDGIIYMLVNLFDSEMNKLKSLAKIKRSVQQSGPIKLFSDQIQVATHEDKIYLSSEQDFTVHSINTKGDILDTYKKKDYKRVKFEDKHKDMIFETIEQNPIQRPFLEIFKQRAEFPKYFPAILGLFVVDDMINIMTWEMEGKKFKLYLFDLDWKLKDEMYIGFQMQGGLTPFPVAFDEGKLYQVIENDDEEWELHVNPIKK
jgi:hypothetical protein